MVLSPGRSGRRPALLTWVALLMMVVGGARLVSDRASDRAAAEADRSRCLDAGPECLEAPASPAVGFAGGARVSAAEACVNTGYLCAELEQDGRVFIRRWKDFSGTVVVHVPAPSFEPSARARELQRAAAAGIRAWNGQPFPILVDERGTREAHFSVRWAQSLGGATLGRTETRWSAATGLEVIGLSLATRSPFAVDRPISARQMRLTAAHEMGHALGLGHSDAERDMMFPTNTATAPSAQDYKTLHALYALDDGTEIVP